MPHATLLKKNGLQSLARVNNFYSSSRFMMATILINSSFVWLDGSNLSGRLVQQTASQVLIKAAPTHGQYIPATDLWYGPMTQHYMKGIALHTVYY